jgi:OmpA-OmpF porin, OOP family
MRARLPLLVSMLSVSAFAEQALVNFHLDPGVGFGLDQLIVVSGASLKVDTTVFKGPVAPQVELFGLSAINSAYLDRGALFGGGLGARLRLFNDEQGYRFNPGSTHTGNWWGNFWVDAHLTLNSGGTGLGFDVGTGAEFSLIEGLSIGPFAKFQLAGGHPMLLFGLSFEIGAPQTTPAEADYDGDGVKGDADKCPDEAEDKDGFEDADGCPDPDNDHDGVDDGHDLCPVEKGLPELKGCPDGDRDGDGVLDSIDRCPTVAGRTDTAGCPDGDDDHDGVRDHDDRCPTVQGPVQNAGCPDPDTDGDGVVDRLDGCVNQAGPAKNKGCPFADTDHDGVSDPFDNCPSAAGPADNQGCPTTEKQLVVITDGKLLIKDKVFFDLGQSTIQGRSHALLAQIAKVLTAHPELTLVQIEGHTDNSGDAALNRALSERRASAVASALVKLGVAEQRLKAAGFGPDKPADTNDTPQGRENNRRVEFTLIEP